jgi:hypothetical protein
LVTPANFCVQTGPCSGSAPVCQGASGWRCNYGPTIEVASNGALAVVETRCDNVDNNCNGQTDETFPLKGQPCSVGGTDMPRPLARLIYLAILCLEKSLPMGGTVRIDATQNGVSLAVDGRRTTPPPGLWALATDGAPVADLRPDGVQFALLRQALAATGHRLEASFTDSAAALRMTAPSPLPA